MLLTLSPLIAHSPCRVTVQCVKTNVNSLSLLLQNTAETPSGPIFFIYFTNWTYVGFGLTSLVGTILTATVGGSVAILFCWLLTSKGLAH